MLGNNIRNLRKQKGYSQETLAEKLNVVRQTISKWENDLSVPDAELLQKMAELFEVSVSDLLGEEIPFKESDTQQSEVAKQLAILNDRLANQSIKRRRIIRRIIIGLLTAMFIFIAVCIFAFWAYKISPRQNVTLTTTGLECQLNGETYYYEISYDENFQIHYAGGDAWIANHVQTETYDDANVLIAQIECLHSVLSGHSQYRIFTGD